MLANIAIPLVTMRVLYLIVTLLIPDIHQGSVPQGEERKAKLQRNTGGNLAGAGILSRLDKSAVDLINRWDQTAKRLRENTSEPAQLVKDLLELNMIQLEIYSHSMTGKPGAAPLRMKCANSTIGLLQGVMDNFKTALRKLKQKVTKGELEEEEGISHFDPEVTLQLCKLYANGCYAYHQVELQKTMTRIDCHMCQWTLPIDEFLAAVPLVYRLSEAIQTIHSGFMHGNHKAAHGFVEKYSVRKKYTSS